MVGGSAHGNEERTGVVGHGVARCLGGGGYKCLLTYEVPPWMWYS